MLLASGVKKPMTACANRQISIDADFGRDDDYGPSELPNVVLISTGQAADAKKGVMLLRGAVQLGVQGS